jgi:AraC family transcriptional regulator
MRGARFPEPIQRTDRQSQVAGYSTPAGSSKGSGWDGIEVEVYNFDRPTRTPPMSFSDLFLSVVLVGTAVAWNEHRRDPQRFSVGQGIIVPAGLVFGACNPEASCWTSIYLESRLIKHVAEELLNSSKGVEIVPQNPVADPQMYHLMLALNGELNSGFASGRLFGESLGNALAALLLTRYSANPLVRRPYRGGLGKYMLRRTIDYMKANLALDIGLAQLAANVGMSQWHFCRMFKQSVGVSPHRYLMQERIARAKVLVENHDLSLADIAKEAGFSDQSHLTSRVRKKGDF